MELERWNAQTDGPLTEQAMRRKLEGKGYEVTRYVYPPGTYFPDHSHSIDKIDAVLTGRFRIVLEGKEVILEPGDAVVVPKGAIHSAVVVGDESVVSLDATKE
jgi:quercetin dioxygenase-like cupin family protein